MKSLRPPWAGETNVLMPERVQSMLLICTQQLSFAAQFRDLKSFVPRRVAIGGHLLAMCPGAISLNMSQQRLMSPGVIRNKLNILDANTVRVTTLDGIAVHATTNQIKLNKSKSKTIGPYGDSGMYRRKVY